MIHYYTNREISQKLDLNLARWKRWSRSFLPPDPLGGMQSGYARQYMFKDVFKVFLGGHLLSHHKLTVGESCQLLAEVTPWLKKMGFLDVNGGNALKSHATASDAPVLVYFTPTFSADGKTGSGFDYLVHRHVMGPEDPPGHLAVRVSGLNGEPTDGSTFFKRARLHMINVAAIRAYLAARLLDQSP